MKFRICATSGKIDKYLKILANYNLQIISKLYYIEIQESEDLLKLLNDLKIELIVSPNYGGEFKNALCEIEIYDGYRF